MRAGDQSGSQDHELTDTGVGRLDEEFVEEVHPHGVVVAGDVVQALNVALFVGVGLRRPVRGNRQRGYTDTVGYSLGVEHHWCVIPGL